MSTPVPDQPIPPVPPVPPAPPAYAPQAPQYAQPDPRYPQPAPYPHQAQPTQASGAQQAYGAPAPGAGTHPGYAQPAHAQREPSSNALTANPLGLVSTIIVGVILVVELISSFTIGSMFATGNYDAYSAVAAIFAGVRALLAVGAIVVGGIALARRGRGKALAGIGLGGGVVVLFGILSQQITNAMLTMFA